MPDDETDNDDLDGAACDLDDVSTYDLPHRGHPTPAEDPDLPISAGAGVSDASTAGAGGPDEGEQSAAVNDTRDEHGNMGGDTATAVAPAAVRQEGGASTPSAATPHMGAPAVSPTAAVFTLTLTFRMRDGLGLSCDNSVQALVGERPPLGALSAGVPPLARVLTLSRQEGARQCDFSALGTQVRELLMAYALKRNAARQAEAQKKKAQAAAERQRKSEANARRLLATPPATTGAPVPEVGTAAATPENRGVVAGTTPDVASTTTSATAPEAVVRAVAPATLQDPPAADTAQLSLFG